jgi:hypothetical protein
MPTLKMELSHLELADQHIATAKRNIAHMEGVLNKARETGLASSDTSEAALAAAQAVLLQFHQHRALILETIADIRAGRLPST